MKEVELTGIQLSSGKMFFKETGPKIEYKSTHIIFNHLDSSMRKK